MDREFGRWLAGGPHPIDGGLATELERSGHDLHDALWSARLLRDGSFFPDHGIERIVAYHERQDDRFARAAADISDSTGKPILTATELAIAQPDNPGPAAVRATGRLCYSSANRAVVALAHLWQHAQFRIARGLL